MPITSIGDRSQSFQSLKQTGDIKTRLNTLTNELASGRRADLTTHMQGNTSQLAILDRELAIIDSFARTNQALAHNLDVLQLNLTTANDLRVELMQDVSQLSPDSSDDALRDGGVKARKDMATFVNLFNARDGERALLSGTAVDTPPLASAEDMLADILASLGGATDLATITATIDTWFDDPAGGFMTMGYQGDTGPDISRKISATQTVEIDARADDAGIRSVLKGTALAAITDLLGTTLDNTTRAELMRESFDVLLSSATPFTRLQARIGENQERLVLTETSQAAQRTTFTMSRNAIALADPYETATRLQDVQRQLELQFASTARLSQLSLVNYL